MVYGKDGRRMLGVAALGLLLGCFESSVAPTTSGDDSSGDPPGGACIPGETQTCLCVGGIEGVQACNDQGSGYDDCTCVTSMSTSGSSGSTTDSPGTSTTAADTGSSSEGAETFADTSVLDTGPPPDGDTYGPCNGDVCPVGELCIGERTGGSSVCAPVCNDDSDCPEPPPDYPGKMSPVCQQQGGGDLGCVLLCNGRTECPAGMLCTLGFCTWPVN